MVSTVPNMKPYNCQALFNLLILVLLVPTLDADSEDYECSPEMKVRRHTKYEAFLGKELRIKCPVTFCNNSPPNISWVKSEEAGFLNVSNDAHIRVEWETINQYEGMFYLSFQSILESDAGLYRCEIFGIVSHNINVYINGHAEPPTVTALSSMSLQQQTNSTSVSDSSVSPPVLDPIWHFMYRIIEILAFFIVVMVIFVTLKCCCKGQSKTLPNPPSHIYENDL